MEENKSPELTEEQRARAKKLLGVAENFAMTVETMAETMKMPPMLVVVALKALEVAYKKAHPKEYAIGCEMLESFEEKMEAEGGEQRI